MRVYDKRKRIERLEARRNAMLSGVYANSNYDPQKQGQQGARREILEQIEQDFGEEARRILEGTTLAKEEAEIDRKMDEDPFFKSARRMRMTPEEKKQIEEEMDQT
jgi:hypothetical protein